MNKKDYRLPQVCLEPRSGGAGPAGSPSIGSVTQYQLPSRID
jgi:hypothetical protein